MLPVEFYSLRMLSLLCALWGGGGEESDCTFRCSKHEAHIVYMVSFVLRISSQDTFMLKRAELSKSFGFGNTAVNGHPSRFITQVTNTAF